VFNSHTALVRYQRIIELAMQGWEQRRIARALGLHYNTVYGALKRSDVRAEIARLQHEAEERMLTQWLSHVEGIRERRENKWQAVEDKRAEKKREYSRRAKLKKKRGSTG